MKNSSFSKFRTTLKNIPTMRILVIASLLFASASLELLHAQGPKLSIQGILKKASGEAVPDDSYTLTFKLYTVASGGIAVWTEMQDDVDVVSGIYSTVLGNTTPLTIAFNQLYYLGVTVGSTEMTPRIQLTSAPYALSLIGVNNQFPSSGQVVADSIDVNGNVLTQLGAPGLNGVDKNGYGFLGDKDSGLYSQAAGQVSLYVNNIEEVKVKPDSMILGTNVLRLNNVAGRINYNGLDDWRLVDIDYFQSGSNLEGWQAYDKCCGEEIGWQNNTGSVANPATLGGSANNFEGRYITALETQVLKKQFNLSSLAGTYNYIKVKFRYYYLDSWDGDADGNQDRAFGAIMKTVDGTGMVIGYHSSEGKWTAHYSDFNTTDFQNANKWGGAAQNSDQTDNAEMTFYKCTSCNDTFWLMFGTSINQAADNENYGVGMVEIWVK